jgi:hypothetical protein
VLPTPVWGFDTTESSRLAFKTASILFLSLYTKRQWKNKRLNRQIRNFIPSKIKLKLLAAI